MAWDTDWSTAVGEVITEIQSLASSVAPIATSASSVLPTVAASSVSGKFIKLFAYGFTSGGTSITPALNGSTVFTFTTAFTGGSNQPFIMEVTFVYDGSKLYIAPVAPINTNDLKPAYVSVGSLTNMDFSIGGTTSVASFEMKQA